MVKNLEETKMHVAKTLQRVRKETGITQEQLADFLGVKSNTVSSWETGQNSIDITILFKICDFLGISINEFSISPNNEESPDLELSEDEIKLITYFRKLSHDNQMKTLGFVEIMAQEK